MTDQRKLAAVMFTDIIGYTSLMSRDEQKALKILEQNRTLQKSLAGKHNGEFLKEMGDGTLLCFQSALDAVRCALAIQEGVKDEADLNLRIGIHLGDIVFRDGDVFGDGVNVASRIERLAEEGDICITEEVYKSVRSYPQIQTEFLREKRLKNVADPVKIYQIMTRSVEIGLSKTSLRITSRKTVLGISVLVIAVLAFIVYLLLPRIHQPAKGIDSLAVLPLENLSLDPEQEFFSDGMTDALITELSKITALKVISRTSVMRFKNTTQTLPEIARLLNVDAVVEGSVLKAQDQVRITAQLIEAREDQHLWADSYQRELKEILILQKEVARTIADQVMATLTPSEINHLSEVRTVDPAAHEAFLKGHYFADQISVASARRALGFFDHAISLDPGFAPAYAGKALAYVVIVSYNALPPKEGWTHVREWAQKALDIDPRNSDAVLMMADVKFLLEWDHKAAEAGYKRSIELNPNNARAYNWYAMFLFSLGRFSEASAMSEKSLELNPLAIGAYFNGVYVHAFSGCFREALGLAKRARELYPRHFNLNGIQGIIYLNSGRYEEAIPLLRSQLDGDLSPGMKDVARARLAYALVKKGEEGEAREILRYLSQRPDSHWVSPTFIAIIHGSLGQKDEAFAWLQKAVDARCSDLTHHALISPYLDPLRSDPRFKTILKQMKLEDLGDPR